MHACWYMHDQINYFDHKQVAVNTAPGGGSSVVEVELVATNTGGSSSLSLHWGALQQGRR
jgi:hypothetical protein